MNTKAIIEFRFHRIRRILQISKGSASVDNIFLDLQNSSYLTQPHSISVNYYSFKIFPVSEWLKPNA